jgi:hypothetical protein
MRTRERGAASAFEFVMRHDLTAIPEALEAPAGRSRLLSRLYRDIGLAAVAAELKLAGKGLEPDLEQSIERGSRYLAPPPPRLGPIASPRIRSA